MKIICYQLTQYSPAVESALAFYNSPFTLLPRRAIQSSLLSTAQAIVANLDASSQPAQVALVREWSRKVVVVGIVSQYNASKALYWLEQGVHHCLVYPFRPEELRLKLIRLLSLQRRHTPQAATDTPQSLKEQLDTHLFLDHRAQVLVKDTVGVYLTGKEYRLLNTLYKRRNQLLSFQQIARLIDPHESNSEASPNLISAYISQLRKKAKKIQAHLRIKSVYGYGYYVEAAGRVDFSAT